MGLFWRRKKDDFVSLGLNEPAEAKPEAEAPPPPVVEPPASTVKEEPQVPSRSPFATSVLGLNLSIEELQAQEAALEQEFSARFRRAVAATRDSLSEKLDTVFAARKQIDDELLDQLEEVLIAADIGVPTTLDILEKVRRGVARKQINDIDTLKQAIKTELLNILQASEREGIASESSVPEGISPYVMMIVGVNGVGKTTTIGKLAQRIKAEGNDVLIPRGGVGAACDLGRTHGRTVDSTEAGN
jgi:fused signal recognition particle receptor